MPQVSPTETYLTETIQRFLRIWGIQELAPNIIIKFSPRLKSSLGLTRVATKEITLNALLEQSSHDLFDEVLCHELAHIAVHELFGPETQPHGREWSELMRQAGYEPNVRLETGAKYEEDSPKSFEHTCPICQTVRFARKRMSNWRCKACLDAGLDGKLLIREIMHQ